MNVREFNRWWMASDYPGSHIEAAWAAWCEMARKAVVFEVD